MVLLWTRCRLTLALFVLWTFFPFFGPFPFLASCLFLGLRALISLYVCRRLLALICQLLFATFPMLASPTPVATLFKMTCLHRFRPSDHQPLPWLSLHVGMVAGTSGPSFPHNGGFIKISHSGTRNTVVHQNWGFSPETSL